MSNLTFTLKWKAKVDLDLYLYCEHGTSINFNNKKCSKCDTELDIDMREGASENVRADGTRG